MASPSGRKPGASRALAQYRRRARFYDLELLAFEPVRREAIARLDLRPGDHVLDVGCGTGLSFEGLQERIGPSGRIVGFDPSPDMLERARQRVADHAWGNVELHRSAAAQAPLRGHADAALFHFTHDVLRHAPSLHHVLAHLKAGAHVVATGLQWAPAWLPATNLFVLGAALYSVSSLDGLARPWDLLGAQLADLRVETRGWGGIYLLAGRKP